MTTADLIGKIVQLVAGIAVFAAVIGLLLFFVDRAPKRGRDVLQLLLFLLPAVDPARGRPRLPGDPHPIAAFADKTGQFIGLDNFVWMFTQPEALHHAAQHGHLGDPRADDRHGHRPRVRRVHRPVARRALLQVADLHADGDLVRRRRHHLAVRLRVPPGEPRPDRPAQPDRRVVRRRTRCSGCRRARSTRCSSSSS